MQAPTSDEQALTHQKQVDNQIAEAIKQNPASLDQAIQEYGDDAPSFIKHMIDVAAENQDEQLLEILKPYAEKFNISAFRCGGKVRAKVKKAKCGKKMEKGGETPIKKEAKGGKPCPCTLHKVGGKLIEVDCNGIPVHYAQQGDNTRNWFTRLADSFASALRQSGANYTPGAGSIAGSIVDGAPSGIVGSPAQESTRNNGVQAQNQRVTIPKSGNFMDWLKENAPEYVGLDKRRELAAKYGISPANGYTGSLEQNLALWDKMKQDRQKGIQFGGPDVQRIESSAALNPTRITVDNSTATAPLAVTRNGDIVRISSLTPGQALSQLNAPAWEEYTRRLRQGILSSKNGGKMSDMKLPSRSFGDIMRIKLDNFKNGVKDFAYNNAFGEVLGWSPMLRHYVYNDPGTSAEEALISMVAPGEAVVSKALGKGAQKVAVQTANAAGKKAVEQTAQKIKYPFGRPESMRRTEAIDGYLENTMNPQARASFEQAMQADPGLKADTDLQKEIIMAIRRKGLLEMLRNEEAQIRNIGLRKQGGQLNYSQYLKLK